MHKKNPEPIPHQPTGNIAAKWNPLNTDSPKETPKVEKSQSTDVSGWKYAISGKGANGGPPKNLLMFTFTLKLNGKSLTDSKKEDLVVYIDAKSKPDRVNIMGGQNGSWHIGFTPPDKGTYWVDFVYRGEFIDEPFSLPIGGNDDYSYTGKERQDWKSKQG